MASMMVVVSKKIFAEQAGTAGPGELLPLKRYDSTHAALRPLADGGSLFCVTARPDDRLWLVAVLDDPRLDASGWHAQANTVPITDITSLIGKLRFANGKGLDAKPGRLGMALQTPRVLADEDVLLLRRATTAARPAKTASAPTTKAGKASGKSTPPDAPPRADGALAQALQALLGEHPPGNYRFFFYSGFLEEYRDSVKPSKPFPHTPSKSWHFDWAWTVRDYPFELVWLLDDGQLVKNPSSETLDDQESASWLVELGEKQGEQVLPAVARWLGDNPALNAVMLQWPQPGSSSQQQQPRTAVRRLAQAAGAHPGRHLGLVDCELQKASLTELGALAAAGKLAGIDVGSDGAHETSAEAFLRELDGAALEHLTVGVNTSARAALGKVVRSNPLVTLEVLPGDESVAFLEPLAVALHGHPTLRRLTLGRYPMIWVGLGPKLAGALGSAALLESVELFITAGEGLGQLLRAPLRRAVIHGARACFADLGDAEAFLDALGACVTLQELRLELPYNQPLPAAWYERLGRLAPETVELRFRSEEEDVAAAFFTGAKSNHRIRTLAANDLCFGDRLSGSMADLFRGNTAIEVCHLDCPFQYGKNARKDVATILAAVAGARRLKLAVLSGFGDGAELRRARPDMVVRTD